jgi:hypothetical protein
MAHTIAGRIVDRQSQQGVAGLRVEAWALLIAYFSIEVLY